MVCMTSKLLHCDMTLSKVNITIVSMSLLLLVLMFLMYFIAVIIVIVLRLLRLYPPTVPSQAPSTIQAYNTSSTSLVVAWGEVPIGYIHGILQGYTLQFKKEKDLNGNWTTVTVAPNVTNSNLTSLDKFTDYVITVKAFTMVGWGPARNVTVSTDEDGKQCVGLIK